MTSHGALQLLEISDAYTPEISGWKFGRIRSVDKPNDCIILKLEGPLRQPRVRDYDEFGEVILGKFELELEEEINSEKYVTMQLSSLIDIRMRNDL